MYITVCFLQGFAGVLEMSIQTDIPPELSGGSKQAAVVTTMAVVPKLQRQGIGGALLNVAEQWAALYRVDVVALFVYRDNDAAIRLGPHHNISSNNSQHGSRTCHLVLHSWLCSLPDCQDHERHTMGCQNFGIASGLYINHISVAICLTVLCRLYENCGFIRAVKWVDPVWLACAEKGVIGPTRRMLYLKHLPTTTT